MHTNSEARVDRVLAVLSTLDPKLTVVSESRQPALLERPPQLPPVETT
ncbi:hypothetical protein [Amycolatopsis sp. NPDC051128]